jgi:hypothetical protein
MKKFLTALFVAVAAVLLPISAAVLITTARAASVSPRTVPLVCPYGDDRSTYDASVQPGIVVPDFSGWPFVPVTYTAYGFNTQTQEPQIIGNINEVDTTDHLVAAWENSTDCGGAADSDGDISRNAWVVDSTGHVFGQSDLSGPPANNFGDASNLMLNQPIVGMTPTSDGQGYWLVAADGGIFDYGDAGFYGSAGSIHLNQPIVGMSVSPDGQGYTLVASDGGAFTYGDAHFYGSLPGVLKPGQTLNSPIEGIVTTPDGGGYWMVAADGGIFTFGDAPFLGSLGSQHLASPIAGMFANGTGYTLVSQDGRLYPFAGPPAPAGPTTPSASPTTTKTTTSTTATTTTQPPDDLSGQPMPTTPPTGYQQIFADDFTSSTLGSNWHEYSGDDFGVYNGQAGTTWDPSHVTVGNGLLTLRTYQDPAHAGPNSPWVEGGVALWLNVNGASDPIYGEYLVRSRVTSATGVTQVMTLWTDTTWPPEIDFNESNGTNSSGATEWYNGANGPTQLQPGVPSGVDLTQWHTWGVITTPSTITYTVDGRVWATMPNYVTTPTHLTLQQMIWPCADPYEACPSSSTPPEVDMQIDWVAVYSPIS